MYENTLLTEVITEMTDEARNTNQTTGQVVNKQTARLSELLYLEEKLKMSAPQMTVIIPHSTGNQEVSLWMFTMDSLGHDCTICHFSHVMFL